MKPEPEVSNGAKRKNTKHWCRGKVGVEHKPVLVVNHNYAQARPRPCQWWPWWKWAGGKREVIKWSWWCKHALRCTECGKYTEYFLKDPHMCPDYKEREA